MIKVDLNNYNDDHPSPVYDSITHNLIISCAQEITAVIEDAGLKPDPNCDSQLLDAIRILHRRHCILSETFLFNVGNPFVANLRMPDPNQVASGTMELSLFHIPEVIHEDQVSFHWNEVKWEFNTTKSGIELTHHEGGIGIKIDTAVAPDLTPFHVLQMKNPRLVRRQ